MVSDSLSVERTVIEKGKTQPRAADNPHWKKKKAEGVHFLVIGNEPFWNLELRNNQSLLFRLAEWEEAVEIPIEGKFESGIINELKGKGIEVSILPQECSDGMSDYGYDYAVTVKYKGKEYKGCGIAL